MARKREFDPDEALDKAMHLFWQQGYADTSVRDLVAFTGVAHAGLYAAFGDKRALFAQALGRYQQMIGDMFYKDLESPEAGRAEVVGFFSKLAVAATRGKFSDGCLIANTGVEFAETPGPERDVFLANLRRLTQGFETALERARRRGEIDGQSDPKQLAAGLAATFHGLSVMARAGAPATMIERSVKAALAQLN